MKNNITDDILKRALYDAMKREIDTYDEPDMEDHHCFSEEFESKMNKLIKTHGRKHIFVKKCGMAVRHWLQYVLHVNVCCVRILMLNTIRL